MRIAVDAMGGDYAPQNVVAGAVDALRSYDKIEKLFLVGDTARMNVQSDSRLQIVHASEVIEMDDPPAQAVRRKKDSSMTRAIDLVKQGEADAIVSAGNTGALMAMAMFQLGVLEGISRPAIAALWPTKRGHSVVLDVGANISCDADQLVDFAVMG